MSSDDDTDMTPEQFRAASATGEPARVVASRGEAELGNAVELFTAALRAHPVRIEHVDDDREAIVGALLAYGWRPPVGIEQVLTAAQSARLPVEGQAMVSRPVMPSRPAGPPPPPPPERDA